MFLETWPCITNIPELTSTAQPTAMMRLCSHGESDLVQLWLDGWLVGRSGYTGMQGLLFVWERSGSGGECHWWLQRGRMNLQEVFSLSLLPHSHSLCLSIFSLCVRTFTVPSLSLLRPRSPGTTTALSCPVNTHPSSTGCLRLPAPEKHRATAPILIHITASAWMCLSVSELNGKLFFTHLTLQTFTQLGVLS